MSNPGHPHPIDIRPYRGRVSVSFAGALVARSDNALLLHEAGYPAVFYLPEADLDPACFVRSQHHTHCPYKGEASYYNLVHDGQVSANAAWTYADPLAAVAPIRGHVAFYSEQVRIDAEPQ